MFKKWIYTRAIQIIIDFIGVYLASIFVYFWRVGWIFSSDFPFEIFAGISFLTSGVWILFLLFTKYYRIPPRSGSRAWYEIALIFIGGIVAVGLMIVSYFFPREILFSRLIAVGILLLGSIYLVMTRSIFRLILAKYKKSAKNSYQTLIIGANRVAEKLIEKINKDKFAPYQVVGVIDPYGFYKEIKDSKILGKLDKLNTICEQKKITAIIQCDAFEHTLNIISLCEEKDIKFQFDPALRGVFEENLRIREIAGQKMISFVQRNFAGIKKVKFKFIDWVLNQVFDVD